MKSLCLPSGLTAGVARGIACFVVFAIGAVAMRAQQPVAEPPPDQVVPQRLSAEELDKLLAPIALYPDALIAIMLPASTVPSDVVLAARYVASNGDPAAIGNQPWDESVKSLARYPDVLKWMDENLEWTATVGDAFLDQPADVMNSVQRLRAQALAAGNLTDTPQQQVITEETYIRIVPAEPEVIYVPEYDPEVVYMQPYRQDFGPIVTFSVGFAVGTWLNYDCDWNRRGVYVGRWRPGWRRDKDWDRDRDWDRGERGWDRGRDWDRDNRGPRTNVINVVNIERETARQWQPRPDSQRRQAQQQRVNRANARLSRQQAREANPRTGSSGASDAGSATIPRPSRIDVPEQGRERIGREARVSDSSPPPGLPATTNGPAVEGRRRATDPDTASSVAPDQGSAPAADREGDARNVRRAEAGGRRDPGRAPDVGGEQVVPAQSGGQESVARNVNKQERGNRRGKGNGGEDRSGAPSDEERVPEPTAPPRAADGQDLPPDRGVDRANKQERDSRQKRDQDKGRPPETRDDDRRGPGRTISPEVENAPALPGTSDGPESSARRKKEQGQRGSQDRRQAKVGQTSPQAGAGKSPGDQGVSSGKDRQQNDARDLRKKSEPGSGNGQLPEADKGPSREKQPRNADQIQSRPSQAGPPQQRSGERKREHQEPPSRPAPKQSKVQSQQPAKVQPTRSAEAAQPKPPSQAPNASQGKGKGRDRGDSEGKQKKGED